MTSPYEAAIKRRQAQAAGAQATSTAANVLASLVVLPLLFVLAWNYGLTEVIENFGGPDANVNVIEGALAYYAVSLLRHGAK
jgi:hypothetical protein